jgi:hypothetical protein
VLEWKRQWRWYWVFADPSLYQFKIERNWLWYFREIDPVIETRLSELDRWLEAHQGWQRYGRLKGHAQHYYRRQGQRTKRRKLDREHQREITRACKNFPEVESAASIRRIRFSFRPIDYHLFPRVAQRRGTPLRTETVRVQILPRGLLSLP